MTRPAFHAARTRAALALGAWCAGILLARSMTIGSPLFWFSLAGVFIAGSVCIRSRLIPVGWLLLGSLVLISTGWTRARTTPDPNQLNQIIQTDAESGSLPLRVRGQIISRITTRYHSETPADPPRLRAVHRSMRLRVDAVQSGDGWIPTTGIITVVLPPDSETAYTVGSIASILGDYRPPGHTTNPGNPDWSARAAQNSRVGTIYTDHDELIGIDRPTQTTDRIVGVFLRARAKARTRAIEAMGLESEHTEANAVMGALILGQRDARFDGVYRSFQRVGIAHMLAISGFHVAIMIGLAVLTLRLLGDFPRAETLVVCALIGAVLILLPLRPPVLRAIILVLVLLGAGGTGRRYDRLTILVWIAIGLLIARPLDLFSLGYQLSVGVTALLLAMPVPEPGEAMRRKHTSRPRSSAGILQRAVRTNTACWALATPAIMLHAGVLTLVAPITTLVMLPIILIMMIVGYVQLLVGFLFPPLAETLCTPANTVASWATDLTLAIDRIPGSSIRAPNLGATWTICATMVIAALILKPRFRAPRFACPVVLLLVIWCAALLSVHRSTHRLRIDMLDVGNGSCILLRSGNQSALFDAGSLDRPVNQTLTRAAHQLNARPVRIAFVSHDNLDHFNALTAAPVDLGLRLVYTTDALEDTPSEAWISVRRTLTDQGVEIRTLHAGDAIPFGNATINVLWPPDDLDPSTRENNSSLVLHIRTQTNAGERSIMLCGDIESESMIEILRSHPGLHADILEAPHHGSPSPELLAFTNYLNPETVLQSTGRARLNDPRLAGVRARTDWLSTADRGALFAQIRRDGSVDRGGFVPQQ